MKRFFTILLVILATPLVALIFSWFVILKPLGEKKLDTFIKSSNIPISGEPLKIFFLGLKSDKPLSLRFGPFPLELKNTSLALQPISLFTLSPKLTLNSTFLEGEIKGSATYKNSSKLLLADFNLNQIQIAKYQLASMLGITSGFLEFAISAEGNPEKTVLPKNIYIRLKDFKKPRESKLPEFISPLSITIPAIENADLIANLSCDDKSCKTDKLKVSSSLGEASGSLAIPHLMQDEISGNITVSLTQNGKKHLLPYFSLLNQDLLSRPEKPFLLKLSGKRRSPKVTVVTIENSL